MKRMNKLMTLAITAITIFAMQSCSKTQFQNGNLVGTWNMTKEVTSSTYVSDRPENAGTSSAIKVEETTELTFTPNGLTGTSEEVYSFDAAGTGGKTSEKYEQEFETDKVTTSTTIVDAGTTTSSITEADVTTTKTYSITFNKDKTFTMTNNSKTISVSNESNTGHDLKKTNTEETSMTASGSWAYIGADKNADEKNKERIGLWFTTSTSESTSENVKDFTDTDSSDDAIFDYSDDDNTSKTENEGTTTGKSTQPDMVWKMVEGSKDEMTVTFMYESSYEGESTSTTTDNSGTTATSSDSENTSTNVSTITFTK
ncbi:MAG: hypothetical protein ACPGVH_03335 [Chitinophagales bacterium]